MKKILFFALFTLFLTFCTEKEDTTKVGNVVMTYQMTQCADPWQQDANYYNDKNGTLKKYLSAQGINAIEVKITENCSASAVCAACICAGCDLATVTVTDSDMVAMEKLKFTKK